MSLCKMYNILSSETIQSEPRVAISVAVAMGGETEVAVRVGLGAGLACEAEWGAKVWDVLSHAQCSGRWGEEREMNKVL